MNKFDIITDDQATIPVTLKVDTVVVHHSATERGDGIGVDTIEQWNIDRAFNEICYHYVVCSDGDIQVGRDVNKQGAHVKHHNSHSIGVCFIGNFSETDPIPLAGSKQFINGALLVKHLQELAFSKNHKMRNRIEMSFAGDLVKILGHREMKGAATECPGKLVNLDMMRGLFDFWWEHREDL